jgi:hypothetical protein
MDAEHLEFPDETFDAATLAWRCFARTRLARPARRGEVKPGGRLRWSWDAPSTSPFLTIAGGAVAQFFQRRRPIRTRRVRFALPRQALRFMLHCRRVCRRIGPALSMTLTCASSDESGSCSRTTRRV